MTILYHETGKFNSGSIIRSKVMGSISWPFPAEFLVSSDNGQFVNIGGFKGRGVVLEFNWNGPEEHILENKMLDTTIVKPGILYHIHFNNIGGDHYWHSRIIPPTTNGLILTNAFLRDPPISEQYCESVIDCDIADDEYIGEANQLIGEGIEISVTGINPQTVEGFFERSHESIKQPNNLPFRIFSSLKISLKKIRGK